MALFFKSLRPLPKSFNTEYRNMAQQGATLQNYNNELVKCIEDLREKREEVNRTILKEEEEKAKIQKVKNPFRIEQTHPCRT